MIKTLTNLLKQDKEKFVVPKGVQDVIPMAAILMMAFSKWERINIQRPTALRILTMLLPAVRIKEAMFLEYSNF